MIKDNCKLSIYGVTDVGLVRDHNEDYIAWDPYLGLVLLADGMGGHNAGEIASELAVTCIREALRVVLTPDMLASDVINFPDALREAVIYANDEIIRLASENLEYTGMGTTIVVQLYHGDRVIMANVGDSRIYRFRQGELIQSTRDHSLVQEMLDNGYISEEEAQQSASRNLITRALGIAETVEVDVLEDTAENGDVYLLCSDGLTDLVSEDEIQQLMMLYADELETATTELVALANEKGGKDNISVILVNIQETDTNSVATEDKSAT
ncbi:MAG TPA: Stp1/IreP family PP2C-type Ser/Thr phosphatase [Chromatiales bacterium]|nr:Stp1/IreP family PP2C-type Ser/Thr phosphatase [Chromatiales bacterium]